MNWEYCEYDSKYLKTNFDCGVPILNDYLKKQMSQDIKRGACVPKLAINEKSEIVGYYTLSAGEVQFDAFPPELKKKIAPYPVSVARIGRLAVCKTMQGKKLGADLIAHAIRGVEGIASQIGIRAIVVDAKDAHAEEFYKHFGFQDLQTHTARKTLFLIV